MSAQPSTPPSPVAPAALAAFLRGMERRAAVLAELQAGDARIGDAAVAATMACFLARAGDAAMPHWPQLFWSQLLAQPALRERQEPALAMPDTAGHLQALGTGPRAALLLRLAAGLDEAAAAAVLGLARPTYRLALQRALPHHADGRPDPGTWQRLHDAVQARLRGLDSGRLQALAQAREAVLCGRAPVPAADPPPAVAARPRRLLAVLWTLLGLCVLALVATFVWPRPATGRAAISREPLAAAESPASVLDADAARIAHPDFALLADPDGERMARDADFAAWLAAQSAAGAGLDGALAPVAPIEDAEPVGMPSDTPESSDAPL